MGTASYAVTFAKGELPPVKGFWSLTMYDPDGSLTIYLGTKSPGKAKETNWLPAPSGNFSLWIRAYWPDQAILDGTWKPPVVSRLQ